MHILGQTLGTHGWIFEQASPFLAEQTLQHGQVSGNTLGLFLLHTSGGHCNNNAQLC